MKRMKRQKYSIITFLMTCFAAFVCFGCMALTKTSLDVNAIETSSIEENVENTTTDSIRLTSARATTDKHECPIWQVEMNPVNQEALDWMIESSAGMDNSTEPSSITPEYVYLTEDVKWDGALQGINGNMIFLCLNGYKADGIIDNSNASKETGNRYIFVADCTPHVCAQCEDGALLFSQSLADYLEFQARQNDSQNNVAGYKLALYEDVVLDINCWTLEDGEATICLNGHTLAYSNGMDPGIIPGLHIVNCNGELYEHVCEAIEGQEFLGLTNGNLNAFAQMVLSAEKGSVFYAELHTNVAFTGEITTLVIPDGVTVHLCLNGKKFTGGYLPVEDGYEAYSAIIVQEGGQIVIYDCSKKGDGFITYALDVKGVEINADSVASLQNYGTCTLRGGCVFGVTALLNAGTFYMENGELLGLFWGITHTGGAINASGSFGEEVVTYLNGGKVYSLMGSLYIASGVIHLNGGFAYGASSKGIIAGWNDTSATIYVNDTYGGTKIHVGAVNEVESKMIEAIMRTGLYGEEAEEENLIGNSGTFLGAEVHEGSQIILNADLQLKISGGYVDASDTINDFIFIDDDRKDENKEALPNDFGKIVVNTTLQKGYFIAGPKVNGVVVTSGAGAHNSTKNFAPCKDYYTKVVDGEIVVYNGKSSGANKSSLSYFSVTPQADLLFNLYVKPDENFVNGVSKFYIRYKETLYEYSAAEGVVNEDCIGYTINVSAKDYGEVVWCYFSDGVETWGSDKVSVEQYFIKLKTSSVTQKTLNVANALERYCESASVYFGVCNAYSSQYTSATVTEVTAETVKDYAPSVATLPMGVTYVGSSLFLTTKVGVRLYFEVDPAYTEELFAQGLNFTISMDNGQSWQSLPAYEAAGVANGYYVEIRDISAENFGLMYVLNLQGYEIKYSVLSSVYTFVSAEKPNPALLEVCKNLYRYYVSVCDYFTPDAIV